MNWVFLISLIFSVINMANSNRLIKEKSPYLLQHSQNPVDWYPWGEEAFEKAKRENKPIFLSIGYSTCHWCHIMEEESFSKNEIAEILNKYFVSIKVDREERPDIDNFYMKAVITMTGSGGWPLTVFLTPEKEPFFGGTYFPPEDRGGRIGLKSLLYSIAKAWTDRKKEISSTKKFLMQMLKEKQMHLTKKLKFNEEILSKAFQQLLLAYDDTYGGFGDSPKFPISHNIFFLLRYWKRTGEQKAYEMVKKTLDSMFSGGMYDQLGGGFHRYSTDEKWFVPHFEKMLYDQALQAKAYLETYQATKNKKYAEISKEIFDYVLREMTNPDGGFYTAEDADSFSSENSKEKKEGAFYLWKKEEILNILGKKNGEVICFYYGVLDNGNIAFDPFGEFEEKNILYQANKIEEVSKKFKIPLETVKKIIEESKIKLHKARLLRPKPFLDYKILTDLNGLMISSLALGSRVLDEPRYRDAAIKSAKFIVKNMMDKDLKLYHSVNKNIEGYLDDYSFFILGLLDLYEATFNFDYFILAKKLTDVMLKIFWDEEKGAFFFTSINTKDLPYRLKEIYDGSIPSGNSVAALNLIRIGKFKMDNSYIEKAIKIFNTFSEEISNYPSRYTQLLCAMEFAFYPSYEIIIAGNKDSDETKKMLKEIFLNFIPNKVVALNTLLKEKNNILKEMPILKNKIPINGKTTAYICKNYTCKLPTTDINKILELLTE